MDADRDGTRRELRFGECPCSLREVDAGRDCTLKALYGERPCLVDASRDCKLLNRVMYGERIAQAFDD